jgi:putative transcriptional regulator
MTFREIRESAGLTQSQLADLVHVRPSSISMIENGQRMPSIKVATDISRVLNSTVEELFGHVSDEQQAIDDGTESVQLPADLPSLAETASDHQHPGGRQ